MFFFFKLLALTIQHEKPDLEEQKTKLLQQEEDKKIQLARLEESLLEVMSSQPSFLLLLLYQIQATSVTHKVYDVSRVVQVILKSQF